MNIFLLSIIVDVATLVNAYIRKTVTYFLYSPFPILYCKATNRSTTCAHIITRDSISCIGS